MTTTTRLKRDPWIKFYFADWRAEPRLKLCSRAARSLWLDMLGVMHESSPYGFLLVEGIAPTPTQLANLVGDPERLVKQWLAELQQAGVFSVVGQPMPDDVEALIPDGVPAATLLSRRMLRDAAKRERDKTNGKGGGNPALTGSGLTGGDNPPRGGGVKLSSKRRLRPRGQKPENPPSPPASPVIPPAQDCWQPYRDRAIALFGHKFCDFTLFPAVIVPLSDTEWALEAGDRLAQSRLKTESQRLHDLLGKTIKFRLAQGAAA